MPSWPRWRQSNESSDDVQRLGLEERASSPSFSSSSNHPSNRYKQPNSPLPPPLRSHSRRPTSSSGPSSPGQSSSPPPSTPFSAFIDGKNAKGLVKLWKPSIASSSSSEAGSQTASAISISAPNTPARYHPLHRSRHDETESSQHARSHSSATIASSKDQHRPPERYTGTQALMDRSVNGAYARSQRDAMSTDTIPGGASGSLPPNLGSSHIPASTTFNGTSSSSSLRTLVSPGAKADLASYSNSSDSSLKAPLRPPPASSSHARTNHVDMPSRRHNNADADRHQLANSMDMAEETAESLDGSLSRPGHARMEAGLGPATPSSVQSPSLMGPPFMATGTSDEAPAMTAAPSSSSIGGSTLSSIAMTKRSTSNKSSSSRHQIATTPIDSSPQPSSGAVKSSTPGSSRQKESSGKTLRGAASSAAIAQVQANGKGDGVSSGDSIRSSTKDTAIASSHRVTAPKLPCALVDVAPPPAMYWSRVPAHGTVPNRSFRAHTTALCDETMWLFGGCGPKGCFGSVWCFDVETLCWSKPKVNGELPAARRAHSATMVEERMFVWAGGDGPLYFNDLCVFDTVSLKWTKPQIIGSSAPSARRAHSANYWRGHIVMYGGGNGVGALDDVWLLDVRDPAQVEWKALKPSGKAPIGRGYHSGNIIDDKLIVIGGSDGHVSFNDVHILALEEDPKTRAISGTWHTVITDQQHSRLGHTSTQVGSYLFIFGGHDSRNYSNQVICLNLVNLQWEDRKIYGAKPPGRGYHQAFLKDSRLFVHGGFDGKEVFDDLFMMDLAGCSYLPQITQFSITLDEGGEDDDGSTPGAEGGTELGE